MYFLGIDIGKRTHVASIMNEEGKVLLKGFSFPNTTEGAESLIERMVDYSGAPSDFVIGMEATGHYWLSIFSYLHESDYLIHVVNPLQTDGWRKGTEIRKRKNDIIDSVLIADLMRYGSFGASKNKKYRIHIIKDKPPIKYQLAKCPNLSDKGKNKFIDINDAKAGKVVKIPIAVPE